MKALKPIFVVWIAIYPTITLLLWLWGSQLQTLPLLLRTLVLTVVLVPLMVLVLIPFWTKRADAGLAWWQRKRGGA